MNEETEEWMRLARTPQTTERIQRWARRERVFTGIMVAALIAVCAWPVVGIVYAVWTTVNGAAPSIANWGWVFGGLIASLAVTVMLHGFAQHNREEAMYADGRVSLGRVDEVIAHPQDADGFVTYSLMISAELPGSVTLRREIHMDHERHAPEKWEGKAIRFRHNTRDPDDLHDILFVGHWIRPDLSKPTRFGERERGR